MKNTRFIRNAFTAAALAAGALLPATGQTIYRCGDSYGQKPCPNGRTIETDGVRSSTDAATARLAARRDAALADTMEKARLKEDAKPASAYIPVSAPKVDDNGSGQAEPVMTKGKKPHTFTAVAPTEKKEKKPKAKSSAKHKTANAAKAAKTTDAADTATGARKVKKAA